METSMNTLDLPWQKQNRGGRIYVLLKSVCVIYIYGVRTNQDRLDACLRSESLSSTLPIQLVSSPPPAWLFGPHQSPQSKPVLDKKKSDLGGAKYFIAPSIAHCDWVVYASIQETNQWATGCSLSLRDGKKKKKNLSASSVRRPTGKMPVMPDYQSSPDLYVSYFICK